MKSLAGVTMLAILALSAGAGSAEAPTADSGPSVELSAEQMQRMGVAVQPLAARSIGESVPVYVRAVDIVPLLALQSDLRATRSAVAASQRELDRLSQLAAQDASASARSVEAARAAAAADASRLELLERRSRIEWSPELAARIQAAPQLVESLARGETALVRADAPGRPNGVDGEVTIEIGSGATPVTGEPVGRCATADPRMQTIGLYAMVSGAGAAFVRPGRVFDGEVRTAQRTVGVVLPRSAVVRVDGSSWVYLRTADSTFQRRVLKDARVIDDGWFARQGFEPGDVVVVAGAESLYAVESGQNSTQAD
ncbi:MAG: hypothetical protein R3E86_14495 [Pseudomonadales bacterium]